jgi:hypothetical protein
LGALVLLGACQVPSTTANPSTDQPATTQSPTPAPTSAEPTEPPPSPAVEKKRVTETQEIPFQTRNVNDSTLAQGTQKVRTNGVPGVKTITYEVTLTGGVETERKVVAETVTKAPVTQVVAVGTKKPPTPKCDPNYSGACVPIASDVDCAGGSGDGPKYVQGPVTVVGQDIYDLDRDGDGIGCE